MSQMLRTISAVPVLIACLALFFLMSMTFADVIMRSVFNSPLEVATELTRILVAVTVFSVMPHISVTGSHIAVDLTDGLFDRLGISRLRDAAVYLVCAVMLWWPVKQVWKLAARMYEYGDVTEYLSIPQYLITGFIAIATGISMISMLVAGIAMIFAPNPANTPSMENPQ